MNVIQFPTARRQQQVDAQRLFRGMPAEYGVPDGTCPIVPGTPPVDLSADTPPRAFLGSVDDQ